MLIFLLIFLLVSNALTTRRDKSILFSRIVIKSFLAYNKLTTGVNVSEYLLATPKLFANYLQFLLNRAFLSLEWCLNSPPKPHAFANLPVQSIFGFIIFTIKKIWDITAPYGLIIYAFLGCCISVVTLRHRDFPAFNKHDYIIKTGSTLYYINRYLTVFMTSGLFIPILNRHFNNPILIDGFYSYWHLYFLLYLVVHIWHLSVSGVWSLLCISYIFPNLPLFRFVWTIDRSLIFPKESMEKSLNDLLQFAPKDLKDQVRILAQYTPILYIFLALNMISYLCRGLGNLFLTLIRFTTMILSFVILFNVMINGDAYDFISIKEVAVSIYSNYNEWLVKAIDFFGLRYTPTPDIDIEVSVDIHWNEIFSNWRNTL